MGLVRTVLGDREVDDAYGILPHEHLLCDFRPISGQLNQVLNEPELIRDELASLDGTLVRCLVEVTPPDLGRDPQGLVFLAKASGLDIVMATGWYRGAFYPPEIDRTPLQDLAEVMIRELTEGVETATGGLVRAGVIGELGSEDSYISAREERVLRAAARASAATGAPITTHTGVYPIGVLQAHMLLEAGASPDRIVIGHADMHLDTAYHDELLKLGVWVQFDTAGRTHLNPDERRADYLVRLLRAGWGERLLISSDRCFRTDLTAFGGVGYAHAVTTFADLLRERGVTDAELRALTVDNPQRVFAWA